MYKIIGNPCCTFLTLEYWSW